MCAESISGIAVFVTIFVAISCYMVTRPEVWWTLPWKMPVDRLDFVIVLPVVLCARRGLRPESERQLNKRNC